MWERSANRLPARPMSVKQQALSVIIDELLQLGVILKSQATSWSQLVLVKNLTVKDGDLPSITVTLIRLLLTRDGKSLTCSR